MLQGFKGSSGYIKDQNFSASVKGFRLFQNSRLKISCTMNMSADQSDDRGKFRLDHVMGKASELWDNCPQSVKSFPWKRALENFIQLVLDLILAVVKYLCVPLLAVTSLSEMSYCAHERRLFLIPLPFLTGVFLAGVLKETGEDLSSVLKDAEVPWHLISIAAFFTFLKLLGPYFPYWGRIFIPHFANGGLWRTLWYSFLWYRRPQRQQTRTSQRNSTDGSQSEQNKL